MYSQNLSESRSSFENDDDVLRNRPSTAHCGAQCWEETGFQRSAGERHSTRQGGVWMPGTVFAVLVS
ncbi:MAG: hypothetical protein SO032_04010, partial [Bifidobacterium pseudolongum]|nr:hypothetical protein [Bifidobacterium pseudolongum]